jgi:hypothetical protein
MHRKLVGTYLDGNTVIADIDVTRFNQHIGAGIWVNTVRIANLTWRQYGHVPYDNVGRRVRVDAPIGRVLGRKGMQDDVGTIVKLDQFRPHQSVRLGRVGGVEMLTVRLRDGEGPGPAPPFPTHTIDYRRLTVVVAPPCIFTRHVNVGTVVGRQQRSPHELVGFYG